MIRQIVSIRKLVNACRATSRFAHREPSWGAPSKQKTPVLRTDYFLLKYL